MTFERAVRELTDSGLNLYRMALFTDGGVRVHQFQPCSRCCNSYSIAKAFVMTAVGMLADDGLLDVNRPVCTLLPGCRFAGMDPGWQLVTVEHALTHTLGVARGYLDIDTEDTRQYGTTDYLSLVFREPLKYLPGVHTQYTDAAFYLLSRVVEAVSGMPVDAFLQERLFTPLAFGETAWSRCPQGHPIGATGLYLECEDMLKLGVLYLNDGCCGGRRFLSSAWVQRAIAREYELHVMTPGGLIGKGGLYGQALVYSREHHFAAAVHAHLARADGERLIAYWDGIDQWTNE
ncbi:MAG: serine hydrolase [Eubacteriales bacterium]|nr:serine hydrolase [Eubacteriales bacterium]